VSHPGEESVPLDAVARRHVGREFVKGKDRLSTREMEAFSSIFKNLKSGSLELFSNLSPQGRNYFIQLAEPHLLDKGDHASLEALYRVDYIRPPVTPLTFLDSTDYLGHLGADVFPAWRPYFQRINGPNNKTHEVIITGAMGIGKAQSLTSKVLTPSGWKRMGDVRVGDTIVDPTGGTTEVVGVYPQGVKPVYRVTFSDGAQAECCDDHLWEVRTPSQKHRGAAGEVLPLREIRGDLRDGAGNRKRFIPMADTGALDAREALPLDPYLLGVLLGDGGLTGTTPRLSSMDESLVDWVRELVPEGVEVRKVPGDNCDYSLTSGRGNTPNPVTDALRELDIMGLDSGSKHIPKTYMRASWHARVALLQGLLDTDGTVGDGSANPTFTSVSEGLARGVRDLAWSLGGVARIKSRHPHCVTGQERVRGQLAYRVTMTLPPTVAPFRLERKAGRYTPGRKYHPARSIDKVEQINNAPCQCIQVANPRGLYVTDDYVVTHNTMFAMLCMTYKIYRVSLLKDPPSFYGMQAKSKIVFGLYAMTRDQVEDVGFYILREQMIDQSPYFAEMFPRSPHGTDSIHWPTKDIHVITGSSQIHAIGQNLYALVADELNYFARGQKTAERARSLVGEVSRRLESRFLAFGGDIPGVAMFLSQTRTSRDFLEQRIRDSKHKEGVITIRGPRWSFDPRPYGDLSSKTEGFREGIDPSFRVFVGDEVQDARILDTMHKRPDGTQVIRPIDPSNEPGDGQIMAVPTQHYKAHFDDLHGALRAIDDVPTASFTPFFPRREVVSLAFDEELEFPFPAQTFRCHEKSNLRLQDLYDYAAVTRINMGSREPIRHPESPRYVHLDLAETGDLAGVAMVHPSVHALRELSVYDAIDPAEVGESEVLKRVEVDFYVGLQSGPFKEPIHFAKIQVFIDWLSRIGYWIRCITADRYQSFDMLQRFRDAGFETDFISLDRTSEGYKTLRQAANENRVSIPFPATLNPKRAALPPADLRRLLEDPQAMTIWKHQQREQRLGKVLLFKELTGLEHDVERDKVDHRDLNPDGSIGSKDLADAVTGAVWKCLTDKMPVDQERPADQRPSSLLGKRLDRYLEYVRRMEAISSGA